jgi:hypothetical protein
MNKKVTAFLLGLLALYAVFSLVNGFLENRTITGTTTTQDVDLSACSLVELDDDRVALTIPSAYVYGVSQDNLDQLAEESSYESIVLNEDGSATYTITKEQHAAMLADLATGINEKLAALPGSDNYEDIVSVEANGDFTDFKVTVSGSTVDFDESMSVMVLKMYAVMYHAFNGETDEVVTISYYNKNDELVASYNSTPGEE